MQCKQTVRCQPDHDTVEHIFWSRLLEVVHDFLAFLAQLFFWHIYNQFNEDFLFLHDCGMMTNSGGRDSARWPNSYI